MKKYPLLDVAYYLSPQRPSLSATLLTLYNIPHVLTSVLQGRTGVNCRLYSCHNLFPLRQSHGQIENFEKTNLLWTLALPVDSASRDASTWLALSCRNVVGTAPAARSDSARSPRLAALPNITSELERYKLPARCPLSLSPKHYCLVLCVCY